MRPIKLKTDIKRPTAQNMTRKSSFFLSLRYEVSLSLEPSLQLYMKLIQLFDIKMRTLHDSFVNSKNVKFINIFQSKKFLTPIKGFAPPCHYYTWVPLPWDYHVVLLFVWKTVFTEIPWSMADLFSAWFSMSFENHSLNSSWESKRVGMMKCSNAHSC